MDLEANRMLLPQERCQACILRRRQKATRRTVRSIAFIAYNVFLFSVVFYTFWYFNDRLARNEKNVADLLQQRSAPEEHTSLGISPLLDSTQAKELQVQEENAEFSNIIESTRRKREAKSKMKRRGKGKRGKKCKTDKTGVRNQRTVSTTTPHFYLTGPDQRSQATENGIFLWSPPPHRSFGHNDDFSTDLTERNRGDGYFTKVIIHQTGVYFVFAKVTANGRSQMSYSDPPPVGIVLMKESSGGEEEELDISWVTQDDRGQNYGIAARHSQESNYPMDSLSVSGLYMLEVNDKIYIQVPQETSLRRNDRFLAEKLKARFGAFLVESCSSC